MNLQRVAVSKLRANPKNPRIIKDEKFQKLVQSIKDFPEMLELRPIVVDGDWMVLGGNMRLKACQAAGLKEVPVAIAADLTPDQQREFIVKDNVGFGEWEWNALANDWDAEALVAWGLDVPFNAEEIGMPELNTPAEKTLEQMTFTLTADQADVVREALEAAKAAGPFADTGNENSNGNALARLAEMALHGLR